MKPHDKILLKNHREIIAPVSVSVFDLNGFSYFSALIHWLAFWPVFHFRFCILGLYLPILDNHYLELNFKTDSAYSLWPIRHLVWQI